MAIEKHAAAGNRSGSMLVVAGLVFAAFLFSYNFAASRAQAQGGTPLVPFGTADASAAGGGGCTMSGGAGGAGGAGGGCCGGGGAPVEGSTSVEGNVQKLTVDTSAGSFNPNVIKAKAGVPIELTFTQAPGGCLSGVMFPDFQINEDLTSGEKTITLPALDPGEYQFSCQMQMVSGTLVVE